MGGGACTVVGRRGRSGRGNEEGCAFPGGGVSPSLARIRTRSPLMQQKKEVEWMGGQARCAIALSESK